MVEEIPKPFGFPDEKGFYKVNESNELALETAAKLVDVWSDRIEFLALSGYVDRDYPENAKKEEYDWRYHIIAGINPSLSKKDRHKFTSAPSTQKEFELAYELARDNMFCDFELNILEERGENIPKLIESNYNSQNNLIGITGEDLLDNYLFEELRVKNMRNTVKKNILVKYLNLKKQGSYENSVFGLPALCILGKEGISLERVMDAYPEVRKCEIEFLRKTELQEPNFKGKIIAMPKRYEKLIKSRVRLDGAEILLLEGKVDVAAARGDADYAIDIVLTGKTCKEENLGFFPPILYLSDGIVIGNKKLKSIYSKSQSSTYLDALSSVTLATKTGDSTLES